MSTVISSPLKQRNEASTEISAEVLALIGKTNSRRVLVTERDIRRFCDATGQEAATSDDGRMIAPPLFYQTMCYEDAPLASLPADGSPSEISVPLPAEKTVGGGSRFEIDMRARSGDLIDVVTRLKDVFTKLGRSGRLYFIVVETQFRNQAGEHMATETATFIKRL